MSLLLLFGGGGVVAPITDTDPPGSTVLTKGPGGTFSRKQFREVMAELEAARAAQQSLLNSEIDSKKARAAAEKAADDVARVAEAIEAYDADAGEVARLAKALMASANAQRNADIARHSRAVSEIARAIIREIEDEEEAIALLLLS